VEASAAEALEDVRESFERHVPQSLDEAGAGLGAVLGELADDAGEYREVLTCRLQASLTSMNAILQATSGMMEALDETAMTVIRNLQE